MARLKSKHTYPPKGYTYIQPETRLRITGSNYENLIKKVVEHRAYKGLARATLEEAVLDVERQICSRLSKNECSPEGPDDVLRPVEESQVLSLSTAFKFSGAALAWLATGAPVVSPELLKKRQDTCLACPLNNAISACKCALFYKAINKLVPAGRRHDGLYVCSACACSLNAKVQMPISMVIQADEGRDIRYATGCWVTEEQACVS